MITKYLLKLGFQVIDSRPLKNPKIRKSALEKIINFLDGRKDLLPHTLQTFPIERIVLEYQLYKKKTLNGAEKNVIKDILPKAFDIYCTENKQSMLQESKKVQTNSTNSHMDTSDRRNSNFERSLVQRSLIPVNGLNNRNEIPDAPRPIATYTPDKKEYKVRATSDESYVIDLCDEVLKMKASRQHKFDFLVGDTGHKLPVDAYYESLNLVIEYHERQHTEAVTFFDNKPTVSGVSRGEQRKIYDQRRAEILPKHGIKLVIISYRDFGTSKKLQRNRNNDILVVKNLLKI